MKGKVSKSFKSVPLGKANIIKKGADITIVAMSYMVIEAIHAAEFLEKHNVLLIIIMICSNMTIHNT